MFSAIKKNFNFWLKFTASFQLKKFKKTENIYNMENYETT